MCMEYGIYIYNFFIIVWNEIFNNFAEFENGLHAILRVINHNNNKLMDYNLNYINN